MDTILNILNGDYLSGFVAKPHESTNINRIEEHFRQFPDRWNITFKFLSETNFKQIPIGRYHLSSDVFVMVSEYDTKNLEKSKFESHRKYIDLQYLASGEELIGLMNKQYFNDSNIYDQERDIIFYEYEGGKLLHATPDNYFVFFPEDIHRPCIKVNDALNVKKIVVKIKY